MKPHDRQCPLHGLCRLGAELHATVQFCADCETHCMCEWVERIRQDERGLIFDSLRTSDLLKVGPDGLVYPAYGTDYVDRFRKLLVPMPRIAEVCRAEL